MRHQEKGETTAMQLQRTCRAIMQLVQHTLTRRNPQKLAACKANCSALCARYAARSSAFHLGGMLDNNLCVTISSPAGLDMQMPIPAVSPLMPLPPACASLKAKPTSPKLCTL